MSRTLKTTLVIGMSVLAAAVVFQCGDIGLRLNEALARAEDSSAFQLLQPDAAAQILVVGDDTGVGTGAALPSASVAGQIAQRYPCVNVVNRARDGAVMRDLAAQIDGTGNTHFDLLLVQAGANDTLRFTGADALGDAAAAVLARARTRADHVVFMNSIRPGNGWLLPPVRGWYQRQARATARILGRAAQAAGVEYVDAQGAETADPAASRSAKRLHPDDETYARWFRLLMRQSQIGSVLQC